MADTKIEWATKVWNPTRGCSRVSAGCDHCYAMREARRHDHPGGAYEGLTRIGARGVDWKGVVRLVPEMLDVPQRWKKSERVFVNSMSDLFHESLRFEDIARVFERMTWGLKLKCRKGDACPCDCGHDAEDYDPDSCKCWAELPWHTYLVLTKRPKRAREFFQWCEEDESGALRNVAPTYAFLLREEGLPLDNLWLGVSVEDQATAEERIPILLRVPAAVRWVSYEPALGPVDFHRLRVNKHATEGPLKPVNYATDLDALRGESVTNLGIGYDAPHVDWIVIGGESGPGARPFDVAWARSTVEQCKAAGVPVFVKQLGRLPCDGYLSAKEIVDGGRGVPRPAGQELTEEQAQSILDEPLPGIVAPVDIRGAFPRSLSLKNRKGGDMSEWPADLRVREFPAVRA